MLYGVGHYEVWQCRSCGLWNTFPIPSRSELGNLYTRKYYKDDFDNIGYVDYEGEREALIKGFKLRLEKIGGLVGNGDWLDVGCALGFLLDEVQKIGFKAYGLDISEFAVQYCKARSSADVRRGWSIFEAYGGKQFDYISLFDILEHSRDPAMLLVEAVNALKPGGVLLLEIWDPFSNISRFLGKRWHAIAPPDHLYYFPSKCVVDFLKRRNMMVVSRWRLAKYICIEAILVKIGLYKPLGKLKFVHKMPSIKINLFDNLLFILKKE